MNVEKSLQRGMALESLQYRGSQMKSPKDMVPFLRRIETSMTSLDSFRDEVDRAREQETKLPLCEAIQNTLQQQVKGLTADFCSNGLPWEGRQCRSARAGLSGIFYCLPALMAPTFSCDQIMWLVQSFLSIMADYVHIHHDAVWHGIDRYFATFNALSMIARCVFGLRPFGTLLAGIPIVCYIVANNAKKRLDLDSWHFYHCLWHVTGGIVLMTAMYLMHTCPTPIPMLELFCQQS